MSGFRKLVLALVAIVLAGPIQAELSVGDQLPSVWASRKAPDSSVGAEAVVGDAEVVDWLLELYRAQPIDVGFAQLVFIEAFTLPAESSLKHYFFEVDGTTDVGVVYVVNSEEVVVDKYTWSLFD